MRELTAGPLLPDPYGQAPYAFQLCNVGSQIAAGRAEEMTQENMTQNGSFKNSLLVWNE